MAALKKTLGATIIAAMLATSAAPAFARPGYGWGNPHGWGGHGGGRWRRDRDDDFGSFLLGAVIAGGIIAIASSAAKAKKDRDNGVVYGGDSNRSDGGSRAEAPRESRNWTDAQNDAANVCADGAEALASKRGVEAKVDDIDFVERDGEGYRVEGRMDGGRSFNCGVRSGELTYIQFDSRVALR
jgi:hypothetical protein